MNTFRTGRTGQSGFTIIELVVVILLLAILAATALPRFIDVSDQARDAVADATAGALATGAALYRAEWIAEGEPAAGPSSFGLTPNAEGYPEATDTSGCAAIYAGLLQSNAPELDSNDFNGGSCEFVLTSGGTLTYNSTTSDVTVTYAADE